MIAAARNRFFDERFIGRDDFDWTLRTLIDDRVLFVDNRFYFDHGPIYSGKGGNVGLIDQDSFVNSSRLLKQFFGDAIVFSTHSNPRWKRERDPQTKMSIRVSLRQQNTYQ